MHIDTTSPHAYLFLFPLWVGGWAFAIWLVRKIYFEPLFRTWCRCTGYAPLEHRIRLRDSYKFRGVTLPIDWPWKYFGIKVADKSGTQREGVVYLGTKEVWVFWLDQGFADRTSWEELLKAKGAQDDDLLA